MSRKGICLGQKANGKSLILPDEVVTQRLGILAVSGAGKSNTAAVLVEGLYERGLPFVVIDPAGNWSGLRSSRDGKGAGLSIPIFGGRNGDVPIERTGGKLIADIVVDERLPCVIDISDFESESARAQFLLGFARQMYRRNEDPIHLVLEEADEYVPQPGGGLTTRGDEGKLLRAWVNIVRRGRARGIGCTMITQRSASLNKNVLTQIDTLIVLRTTGPQDRTAIEKWVSYHGEDKQIIASLPSLETGTAWVWSPAWLKCQERIQVPLRSTFDSAATPSNVRAKRRPATLASIDLGAIEKAMAETIERAAQNDPEALRRDLASAKAMIQRLESRKPEAPAQVVEVPILKAKDRQALERTAAKAEAAAEVADQAAVKLATLNATLLEAAEAHRETLAAFDKGPPQVQRVSVGVPGGPTIGVTPRQPRRTRKPQPGDPALKGGARKMLRVLAGLHPVRVTKAQLGTLSGYTPSGGTFGGHWGDLGRAGFLDSRNGDVGISGEGLDFLGEDVPPAPQTTEEVQAMWRQGLGQAGATKMMDVLIEVYPQGLTREDLGQRTDLTATGGTFGKHLGLLRRNGLAEVNGAIIRASAALFLPGPG